MAIALFFAAHWFFAAFFQSVFLHRYASHGMFAMSRFWERVFYLLTFLSIGASFFNPRAYAVMHRRHHAYADAEGDPHSPRQFGNFFSLLWGTIVAYLKIDREGPQPGDPFERRCPRWERFDRWTNRWSVRWLFAAAYVVFYACFATAWWMYLLLPAHLLMGGVHGTLVNWLGHRYGYASFDTKDDSRNSFPLDFLIAGELLQNNHHRFPGRPNFAVRAFEIDPVYPVLAVFDRLGIVALK